jgi:predicted dithiol-disulfide oxidoreductase (DUF899 family)
MTPPKGGNVMTQHQTATREDWLAARVELLNREKNLTRLSDDVARQRQELPWVRIDKDYEFETQDGPRSLGDLFDGRSQLIVYHLMFGPDDELACLGCSYTADGMAGSVPHLEQHDVTFVAASRAPLSKLEAYKAKMGWTFPWVSSGPSDFNVDFAVFTEEERRTGRGWNFGTPKHADEINIHEMELHGLSTFVLEDGVVYHAYSTYDRGTDVVNGTWQLLDRVPKGRDEANHPDWPKRRYEYG